jgi:hypothetical protein
MLPAVISVAGKIGVRVKEANQVKQTGRRIFHGSGSELIEVAAAEETLDPQGFLGRAD